jgi:A/G-specific adenine glycosylase
MKFSNTLIHWYLQNKRSALAWYHKSLCNLALEIMLQQTRVAQGAYFLAFSAAFPTVFDLAEANEEC